MKISSGILLLTVTIASFTAHARDNERASGPTYRVAQAPQASRTYQCKMQKDTEVTCIAGLKPPHDGSLRADENISANQLHALGYTARWTSEKLQVGGKPLNGAGTYLPGLDLSRCEALCSKSFPGVGQKRWCLFEKIEDDDGGYCILYTDDTCGETATVDPHNLTHHFPKLPRRHVWSASCR